MTPRKPKAPAVPAWDAFWAEVDAEQAAETEIICGVEVRVPNDLTLRFSARLQAVTDTGAEEVAAELVADLFGPTIFEQWVEKGMTDKQFMVIFAWGMSAAKGQRITFREAYNLVASGDGWGKPLAAANRATRRAASKTPSTTTGRPSRPTSTASTTSRPRKSQT